MSKTAYAASSLVNMPRCNVSQDTIAVEISSTWKKKLLTGYLVTFLNTKHGLALMERQFQGNVQAHLLLPDGRKLPIPLFGPEFQKHVQDTVLKADALLIASKQDMAVAEHTLLRALGLDGWEPPEPLTYTRRASEALAAARLDAEYFAPRVERLLTQLRADGLTVADVAPVRRDAFDPKAPKARPIPAQGNALGNSPRTDGALKGRSMRTADWNAPSGLHECGDTVPGALPQAGMERAFGPQTDAPADTFPYLEIRALRSDGTCTSEAVPLDEAPSRATQHVHRGDVITSTVRPIRRLSALILPEQHEHVCSSGFVVLNPQAIAPEVLLTYLRLPIICELMDLHTSASLYPAISERDLLKLPIPRIADKTAKEIITRVRQAHTARQEAQTLLARAKRAVEVAIEQDEAAAQALLRG